MQQLNMPNEKIQKLIEILETIEAPVEEKDALIEKVSDDSVSLEDKKKLISEFMEKQVNNIDEQIKSQIQPIVDEMGDELSAAEEEYNQTMDELHKEAIGVEKEIAEDLDL